MSLDVITSEPLMGRKRTKLVPETGVECLEVRIVLFFDEAGDECIAFELSDGSDTAPKPSLHQVLGVIEEGKAFIVERYSRG